MHKITRAMYDSYRSSLEKTLGKNQHCLTTKVLPINCVLAREIGMQLSPEVVSALKNVPPTSSVSTLLRLVDYAEAMEAYGTERWGLPGFDVEESRDQLQEPETKPELKPEDKEVDTTNE